MKKVILMMMAALLLLGNTKAIGNNNIPPDGIKITITVEIGAPFTCALKWSICKITLGGGALAGTAELLQGSDEKTSGGGSGGGGGASWLVSIPRDNFAKYYPGYLSKLDSKNTVTFESSYVLPSDVSKALGTTRELVIEGNVAYPLKFENGVYTITFPSK